MLFKFKWITILWPKLQDNMDGNEDEELNEKKSKTAGGFTGRGVTLQMLLEDNILQPKEGAMSLEYMVNIKWYFF